MECSPRRAGQAVASGVIPEARRSGIGFGVGVGVDVGFGVGVDVGVPLV